jgi:hypothetical protein
VEKVDCGLNLKAMAGEKGRRETMENTRLDQINNMLELSTKRMKMITDLMKQPLGKKGSDYIDDIKLIKLAQKECELQVKLYMIFEMEQEKGKGSAKKGMKSKKPS